MQVPFRVLFLLSAIMPVVCLCADSATLLQRAEQHIDKGQFALAEPLLQKAVSADPKDTQALYRLGYVQYRQRKLAAARQSFGEVVKLAPPALYSRYFLGRIALLENKPAEAVQWLEPVQASNQQIFDAAAQLAIAYSRVGSPQKAIAPLRAAIAETPWDGSLYYRLGQLYKDSGNAELAREAFESSSRLKNATREDVEVLMQVSKAISEGKPSDAVQLGAKILQRDKADPDSLVALGALFGKANLQAEALDAFQRAAKGNPGLFQAQYNRGLALLRLNRSDEAISALARAVELLPQSLEANMTYGLANVMARNYAAAIEPLERAWQMDKENSRVGALLATSYLRAGSPAKAVEVLRSEAFRNNPEPAPALLLVEALDAAHDSNGAREAALVAQQRFPQVPQAHMAVAQQLVKAGKYSEARTAFEAVLRVAPGQPDAELGLADSLQKGGDHQGALEHYRAALSAPHTALSARTGLARSLAALRRFDDARKALEEGVATHPEDMNLHIELSRVYARLGERDLAAEQTKIVERLRARQGQ